MEQKTGRKRIRPVFAILRLIPTVIVLAILFYFRDLFFSADTLSTVQVIVPLESCREAVFIFLVVLTVLVGLDGIRATYFSKRDRKEKRYAFGSPVRTVIAFAVIFANAVLSFYEIELINNYYLYSMETRYIWLGIFITLAIYLILVFIVNSVSLGMIVGNCFFFAWGAANYFVQQFRGVPLQFIDLASFQTALNVSGNYSYEPNWEMVACLALTCAVCGLYIHAGYWHNFRRIPGKLASRAVSVAIAAGFVGLLFHTDFLTDQGIWLRDWQPWYTYRLFGMESGFLAFAKASFPKAPDTYSADTVSKIISTSEKKANETADSSADGGTDSSSVVPENIICIMDEAFSDLSIYPGLQTSTDVMPFINSMSDNTQEGKLLVSVKGGTTANTEYEFLTGNSCVLSPSTVVYNSFIKQDQYSLARTLSAQGYTVTAMHPYYKNGWNREFVYPRMGFDDFLSLDNYFDGDELVRGFVSDMADVKEIEKQTENKKAGQKTFIFNVTMQNHSEYKNPAFQSTVSVLNFNGTNKGQAEQYLSLIQLTDQAVEQLINYYSQSDQKTLICFWGDHQPQIGDDFWEYCLGTNSLDDLTADQEEMMYTTRYFIWANYDIPEAKEQTMSANYLSSYLLSLTGLQSTGYNDYLMQQREDIPAMNAYGYLDSDGEAHLWSDENLEQTVQNDIENYKCLIYDELTNHDRDADFYGISDNG